MYALMRISDGLSRQKVMNVGRSLQFQEYLVSGTFRIK